METRTAAADGEAVTASKPARRLFTASALDADAVRLATRRKQAHNAAVWAHANASGSKAVCNSGRFGDDLTYNMIEPLLRELKKERCIAAARDHHRQILTNEERRQLAEWMMACADGQAPKDRMQISVKVREMLWALHASNKKRKWR